MYNGLNPWLSYSTKQLNSYHPFQLRQVIGLWYSTVSNLDSNIHWSKAEYIISALTHYCLSKTIHTGLNFLFFFQCNENRYWQALIKFAMYVSRAGFFFLLLKIIIWNKCFSSFYFWNNIIFKSIRIFFVNKKIKTKNLNVIVKTSLWN